MKRLLGALLFVLMLPATVCAAAADGPPEVPPGAGIGVEPGYTRTEPGHWEHTDTLYFGSIDEERTADGVTVLASLENEKKDIIFTFTDSGGEQAVYTVTPYWFPDRCYAEDSFAVGVNIVRSPDEDQEFGEVTASVVIAEVTPGEGRYGFEPEVISYFKKPDGTEVQRFGVHENMTFSEGSAGKYYIDLRGRFPAGEEDGQKLYAVVGTQDEPGRETRVFIAYVYRWVDEPETIEVPDQYGPVEFHNTPAGKPVLYGLIIGAVMSVFVIIVFLRKRRKK
ncbi:MAG: hypothetical protein VZR05_07490 [Lachnospiraceae bacterium]|nr:hypothetical protein [Lachnospiraceae bacterium]